MATPQELETYKAGVIRDMLNFIRTGHEEYIKSYCIKMFAETRTIPKSKRFKSQVALRLLLENPQVSAVLS